MAPTPAPAKPPADTAAARAKIPASLTTGTLRVVGTGTLGIAASSASKNVSTGPLVVRGTGSLGLSAGFAPKALATGALVVRGTGSLAR